MLIFLDVVYFSLLLFIFSVRNNTAQVSITFSPNEPLCVGEQVEMVCFIEPPPPDTFGLTTAQVSFNGSTPTTLDNINNNEVVGGVDLARYSANTDGLTLTSARPGIRLIISSYLPFDTATTFGCHGAFPNATDSEAIVSGMPMGQASPPLPPPSLTATFSGFNANTCEGRVNLAWTAGASDRDVEYFLFRDGADLDSFNSSVTLSSFLTTLELNTEYSYSIRAMSCAGNSTTQTADSISVLSYSLAENNPQLFPTYIQSNGMLTLEWSLLPSPGVEALLIEYSLDVVYNHTLSGTTDQFSDSSTFSQLSTDTIYSINITPHNFSDNSGVLTNIFSCLNITQQCGQDFAGAQICSLYNSDNPPVSTPATATATSVNATSITPTAGLEVLPIIIGVVGAVGGILLILFIVLFFIMLYICCIRNRGTASPKRSVPDDNIVLATTTNSDTQPDATYAQIHKPNTSATADLYSSVNKHRPAPYPDLTYAELDHVRSATDRVNPSSVPSTNYSDLAQLPRAEQTTYATVTDGPRQY